MITEHLAILFERDLNRLKKEITAYENESDLWILKGDVNNSAGNLCLHLIGNLKHFIGHALGGTDYIRTRDKEFNDKNVPVAEMLVSIDETIEVVKTSLAKVTPEVLAAEFPIPVFKEGVNTQLFLLHLNGHLNYHLGQISYHRRILG